MTDRHLGTMVGARGVLAFALAASTLAPAIAQQAETPTPAPAPSPTRPIDFRLPPATDNDGRAPGVQGPSNNGLAPLAPGERRGPQPTPTPTASPMPPRTTPTQPPTTPPQSAQAQPRSEQPAVRPAVEATPRSAPAPAPDGPAVPAAVTADEDSTDLPTANPDATDPATVPADGAARAPAPPPTGDGPPLWAWLLVGLAAVGAGVLYWRRRPALAGDSSAAPSNATADSRPAAPRDRAPAPQPPAPPPAAPPSAVPKLPALAGGDPPQRAPSPLVTRPAPERRALVSIALDVTAIRLTPDHIAVGFTLNLVNQGAADATGLMVRIALNQGSAMPEAVLARFFDGAGGSVLRDDMELKIGAGEGLTTEALLPRAIVEPLMIGGKPMLVPVMAFDVTYHWEGDSDAFGQVAGSFVLGREQGMSGSDKLSPLALDRASYTVDRPGARATAVRRSQ